VREFIAGLLLLAALRADAAEVAVEDPTDSLAGFRTALARTASGDRGAITRIVHIGDSLIVADGLTGAMRERLQTRFGDAGHGFVLLGEPWNFYRHHHVLSGASGRWKQYRLTHPRDLAGLYGLGGVSFRASRRGARVWVATDPEGPIGQKAARIEISYLRQPGGGSMDLFVDGEPVGRVSTRADSTQSGFFTILAPDDEHRLEIRTTGDGEVRLYGAVLERAGPGVVYDAIAVTGARAAAFLDADESHFEEQLARRRPDLVVVGLGTNESSSPNVPGVQVEARTGELLARIRSVSRACLVVSPPDRVGSRAGGDTTPDSLPRVVEAQRRAAMDAGCAFFDTYRAMGGHGAMLRWWRRGLSAPDRRHLNEAGAAALADLLMSAILGEGAAPAP
jgi:lysophospholipase L1-like esterase